MDLLITVCICCMIGHDSHSKQMKGFRKVDPEQWEFANEEFARGQKHLLNNIHRRKPVHSHSLQAQGSSLSDAERYELEGNIERLKHEKGSLLVELNMHMEQQNGVERKMLVMEEKMQTLLNRQRDIMESLSNIVQIPGFLSNLVPRPDFSCKKRRLLMNECAQEDADKIQRLDIQAASTQKSESEFIQSLDLVPFQKLESTLNTLENFFHGVSLASGMEVEHLPCAVFPHILTSENFVDSPSSSPKLRPSSPSNGHIRSSPEPADSESFVEHSSPSSSEVSRIVRVNISDIDVNSKPVAPKAHLSQDPAIGTLVVPTGGNDVFWQQFFTEAPGSDTQEVQSERKEERKEAAERKTEASKVEWGNFWWNRKNVDHHIGKIDV
ncbi:Heat stress transcription factor A-4b [Platanthera zijinensis]|uniref:Heat stress transcription factor A-4b n=1 Tax=Platanthera zijinensis TaxID=2320716 RepID=A0AAP0G5T3_9ASPA